jgi:hypothetical protein
MNRRGRWLVAVLAAVTGVTLLALNVTGIAPIPTGPLGDHQPAVSDGAGATTVPYVLQRVPEYLTPLVENTGPFSATIVRVTPTGTTIPGSVVILGSLPFNRDDPAESGPDGMDRITLGIGPDPGPGWASPQPVTGVTVEPERAGQHQGRAFLARITPDPTEETAVLRFDVEYTIGPLHFLTTAWGPVGTTLIMCGRERPVVADGGCQAR